MNNNHISNLTEQELLTDALTTEKHLIGAYGTFISEATCKNLRTELSSIITETQEVQYDIYNAMKQKGWYPSKNADSNEITQTVQKFGEIQQQLQ